MNKNQVVFVLGLIIVFFIVVIIANNQDSFKPGDVVYSILDPERFAEQHGDDWVLLDGSEISDCKLYSMGFDTIPDAQGVFIRAMDTRDKLDKNRRDSIRKVGSYQDDAFKQHFHGIQWTVKDPEFIDGKWNNVFPKLPNGYSHIESNSTSKGATPKGGSETRPKNITLYIYIKID